MEKEKMMDLIDRQAAIDALHTWFQDGFEEDKWWNSTHVLAALEGVPSAQPDLQPTCNQLATDCISRQAAIDAIESHIRTAEEPYQLTQTDKALNYAFEVSASCVYNLPSAQLEIIRCKDCIHRPVAPIGYDNSIDNGFDLMFPDYICPCGCEDGYYAWYPKDSFYCGNAERRTDG